MDFYEALSKVKRVVRELQREWVFLDQALGRFCAMAIHAPMDIPLLPLSRWDGYALRSEDTIKASSNRPVCLELIEKVVITAGAPKEVVVSPGQCVRIMTGGVIPAGCDAVVKQEEVREEKGRIFVNFHLSPGDGVIRPGEMIPKGEVIAQKGMMISPYNLSLFAETGTTILPLFRRPRVGFLAVGSELAFPGAGIKPSMRYAGGQYFLASLARRIFGASTVNLGIAEDDPYEIEKAVDSARCLDLLVTTGGTGKGIKDHIEDVWKRLNVKPLFSKLNIRPGGTSKCGLLNNMLWLALPGGARSGVVIFAEILNEISLVWYDRRESMMPRLRVKFSGPEYGHTFGFCDTYCGFLGRIEKRDGELMFRFQKDALHRALNAYIILPPGEKPPLEGETVQATLLMSGWD